jgi:hypothetical protein
LVPSSQGKGRSRKKPKKKTDFANLYSDI